MTGAIAIIILIAIAYIVVVVAVAPIIGKSMTFGLDGPDELAARAGRLEGESESAPARERDSLQTGK
jgi:hypothetical protein